MKSKTRHYLHLAESEEGVALVSPLPKPLSEEELALKKWLLQSRESRPEQEREASAEEILALLDLEVQLEDQAESEWMPILEHLALEVKIRLKIFEWNQNFKALRKEGLRLQRLEALFNLCNERLRFFELLVSEDDESNPGPGKELN